MGFGKTEVPMTVDFIIRSRDFEVGWLANYDLGCVLNNRPYSTKWRSEEIFFDEVAFCPQCSNYVLECSHPKDELLRVSGTEIRNCLNNGKKISQTDPHGTHGKCRRI